jgi:prepilin-type N-terminal cleavage/methylation domain-containing protein
MNLRSVVRNPGSVPFSGRRRRNAGLSLLEVILAIAILGGCIAVIGELVRLGARQAEEARELTTAQLLCESKLEEIAAGVSRPSRSATCRSKRTLAGATRSKSARSIPRICSRSR